MVLYIHFDNESAVDIEKNKVYLYLLALKTDSISVFKFFGFIDSEGVYNSQDLYISK